MQGWAPGSTGTGQPEKTGATARNRPEPPAYFPVEPGKTGAFQPEPPGFWFTFTRLYLSKKKNFYLK